VKGQLDYYQVDVVRLRKKERYKYSAEEGEFLLLLFASVIRCKLTPAADSLFSCGCGWMCDDEEGSVFHVAKITKKEHTLPCFVVFDFTLSGCYLLVFLACFKAFIG
jgi:hypothetical protein